MLNLSNWAPPNNLVKRTLYGSVISARLRETIFQSDIIEMSFSAGEEALRDSIQAGDAIIQMDTFRTPGHVGNATRLSTTPRVEGMDDEEGREESLKRNEAERVSTAVEPETAQVEAKKHLFSPIPQFSWKVGLWSPNQRARGLIRNLESAPGYAHRNGL